MTNTHCAIPFVIEHLEYEPTGAVYDEFFVATGQKHGFVGEAEALSTTAIRTCTLELTGILWIVSNLAMHRGGVRIWIQKVSHTTAGNSMVGRGPALYEITPHRN